jgi:hypothetical protein
MPKSFNNIYIYIYIYAFSCFTIHVILMNFVQIMATNILNIFSFGIWFKFIALITLNQILTIFLHNPFKFSYHICHRNITKLSRYFLIRMFDWLHSFFHFSNRISKRIFEFEVLMFALPIALFYFILPPPLWNVP